MPGVRAEAVEIELASFNVCVICCLSDVPWYAMPPLRDAGGAGFIRVVVVVKDSGQKVLVEDQAALAADGRHLRSVGRQRGQGDPRGLDPWLSANPRAGRSVAVMTVDASRIGLFLGA